MVGLTLTFKVATVPQANGMITFASVVGIVERLICLQRLWEHILLLVWMIALDMPFFFTHTKFYHYPLKVDVSSISLRLEERTIQINF